MKKPVKKMDGGMMTRPGVMSGGIKKIGRRDEGNDEMRRGIPNRSERPSQSEMRKKMEMERPRMQKPNMGKPDVSLPYMPQNPMKNPPTGGPMQPVKPSMPTMPRSMNMPGEMPLRRAKGGSASKSKWIQEAIKKPNALRSALGAKKGEPIPAAKLEKATHSKNPKMAKRANLAMTLRGMKKK